QDGNWQKYDNGSWGSVNRPEPQNRATTQSATDGARGATRSTSSADTVRQLDRDRAARSEGATRTRDYGAARSGGDRAGQSYRPSTGARSSGGARAGGARAGGGRRR